MQRYLYDKILCHKLEKPAKQNSNSIKTQNRNRIKKNKIEKREKEAHLASQATTAH
jgi:hypothetical protein